MRKRISIIWSVSEEKFKEIVKTYKSKTNILKYFGLKNHGNNYKTLVERLAHCNLKPEITDQYRGIKKEAVPLDQVLVRDSNYSRHLIKKRIILENIIPYKCKKCGLDPIWNNEKLVLVLDHENGINNDNRIENLRFLCPNCNSQTETFTGRNRKYTKNNCSICGCVISKKSKFCRKCFANKRVKTNKPTKEELYILIWKMPITEIAKIYHVSDKAVAKWISRYNLEKPNRGHWIRRRLV